MSEISGEGALSAQSASVEAPTVFVLYQIVYGEDDYGNVETDIKIIGVYRDGSVPQARVREVNEALKVLKPFAFPSVNVRCEEVPLW